MWVGGGEKLPTGKGDDPFGNLLHLDLGGSYMGISYLKVLGAYISDLCTFIYICDHT